MASLLDRKSPYASFLTPGSDLKNQIIGIPSGETPSSTAQGGQIDPATGQLMTPAAKAQSMGYQVQGTNAIGSFGPKGYKTVTPLSMVGAGVGGAGVSSPGGGAGVGNVPGMDQLRQAAGSDVARQQDAANRQFTRNQGQIDAYGQFLNTAPGQITGQANQGAQRLQEVAGQAAALGNQQKADFQKSAQAVQGRVDSHLGAAYGKADQAAAGYQKAINDYQDRGAQDASAMAFGIRRNAQAAMQQASAGVHPDGSPMSPEEQQAAIEQVRQGVNQQVQEAVTPILTHYNDTKAQLEGNLASIKMSGASLRVQGAGLEGQTGTALLGEQGRMEQNRTQLYAISSGMEQFAAQLKQTGVLNAVNLEMQGRNTLADLVSRNPETVVSTFNSLMAMYSLGAAQRANQGFSFGASGRKANGVPNSLPQEIKSAGGGPSPIGQSGEGTASGGGPLMGPQNPWGWGNQAPSEDPSTEEISRSNLDPGTYEKKYGQFNLEQPTGAKR